MFDGGREKLHLFDIRMYYTATIIKRVQNCVGVELDLIEQRKFKNSFKCICKYSDCKGILHWWEQGWIIQ